MFIIHSCRFAVFFRNAASLALVGVYQSKLQLPKWRGFPTMLTSYTQFIV
jgi:hypothetical protein